MSLGRGFLARASQAAYFMRQHALVGIPLDTLWILLAAGGLAILGWNGWREGLAWEHGLGFAAGALAIGLLYWLRVRRYTFFTAVPYRVDDTLEPLAPEERIRMRASGELAVGGNQAWFMGVPALFWITELGEYILMARVAFAKLPLLEATLEEQGMWYGFIQPDAITRITTGRLHFGAGHQLGIELGYLDEGGGSHLLYLVCDAREEYPKLLQDLIWRSRLTPEPGWPDEAAPATDAR